MRGGGGAEGAEGVEMLRGTISYRPYKGVHEV